MKWLVPILCAVVAGCDSSSVELQGLMLDGWEDDAVPYGGAYVRVMTLDEEPYSGDVSADSGLFRVEAPGGIAVLLQVEGDGLTPASFQGVSGLNGRHRIANGEIFAVRTERLDAWRALFAGCPGADGRGTAVFGQIRVIDIVADESGEHPIVTRGFAKIVQASDADDMIACYLDDAGQAYDPEASRTGATGQYAIFGVEPGWQELEIGFDITSSQTQTARYDIWIPEEGVVARFPSWIEFAW